MYKSCIQYKAVLQSSPLYAHFASSKKKLTSLSSAHSKQRHSLGNKQSVLTHNCSSIQDYRIEMN